MTGKPTLLLLPGLLCDETAFVHQASALGDVCNIVIPDFRGLDSLEAMAKRAIEMAPERFSLAGFSMGGRTAFQVMRLASERVERLCLIDTSSGPEPEGGAAARQPLVDLAYNEGMEALARAWLPGMLAKAQRSDDAFQKPLIEMIYRSSPESHEKQVKALVSRPDARPLLPGIRCPTLAICGEEDALTTPSMHADMAAAIPGAQLHIVPGAGHFLCYERPEPFNAALRNWLAR